MPFEIPGEDVESVTPPMRKGKGGKSKRKGKGGFMDALRNAKRKGKR
jgi:hypothetical protein